MELTSILSFLYAIFGIGVIIFIHELGHFLLAKRVGVRVEKFCLGFDPMIRGRRLLFFSFRRGETEYVLGAIPFGGYVKMAGETVLDRRGAGGDSPRPDELLAKRPGQRAMVFVAGAAFNVISAFLFFILAFKIGVSFTAPVIGRTEPGRPAWKAGLRTGDLVEEIDGERISDFHEIAIASALGSPERPRRFRVRRGETVHEFDIAPAWSPEHGFHTIGVIPTFDPRVQEVKKGSAAERAGISAGDHVDGLRVQGVFVPWPVALSGQVLSEFLTAHPGAEFELGVRGEGGRGPLVWKAIRLERKPSPRAERQLGVKLVQTAVAAVRPRSPAAAVLAAGDRVRAAGGRPAVSLDWQTVRESFGVAGPVELEVESLLGETRKVTLDAAELIRWSFDRDVHWTAPRLRVGKVREGSPLAGKLIEGDLVAAAGEKASPVFDADELRRVLLADGSRARLWYRRGGEVRSVETEVGEDLGIEWNTPLRVQVLPGRPAALQGMESGSRVVEVDGRPLRSWEDLQEAVRGARGSEVLVKWVPPGEAAGPPRQARVNLLAGDRLESYEELGIGSRFLQTVVRAGILDSFALGARRTVVVAQHVFLTLKGLLKREVAAKNLAGPVGIVNLIFHVSEYGLGTLIYYLALISVNLGLFNLLPFPILDGGHLLFLAIEKIKGSPVSVRVQEIATTVAFFLIIGLALFVTYNDLRRLFGL